MAVIIFRTFRFYNVFPPFLMDLSYFIYFYYVSTEPFLVFYKSNFLKRLFLLSATFLKIELLVFVKIKVKVFILFYCYTTSNVQQENKWKLSVTLDVLHTHIQVVWLTLAFCMWTQKRNILHNFPIYSKDKAIFTFTHFPFPCFFHPRQLQ